jgi:hypothetical protein
MTMIPLFEVDGQTIRYTIAEYWPEGDYAEDSNFDPQPHTIIGKVVGEVGHPRLGNQGFKVTCPCGTVHLLSRYTRVEVVTL